MVSEAPAAAPPTAAPGMDGPRIAVAGGLADDLRLGLMANGVVPEVIYTAVLPPGTQAVYVPNAQLDALHALIPLGVPVITDADVSDPQRVQALMALGVVDVLPQPVRVETLAQKIQRAIRRGKRRRNR